MKINKIFIACLAAVSVLLYGCSDDGKGDSENVNGNSTAAESSSEDSELKAPPKPVNNSAKFDVPEGKSTLFKGSEYGIRVGDLYTTGIYLYAPKGMNIHNDKTIDNHTVILANSIPTSSEPVLISDENGSNMNLFASAGQDYDEFAGLEQSDVEKTFLEGVRDAFDKCEIVSFEKGVYDGYQGIKMVTYSEMQGLSFKQTILMINVVKQGSDGYTYTITYTDMTGNNDEAIETSISTIVFADIENLAKEYPVPEDLAEIQKEEAEKKAENFNNYTGTVDTKVTMPKRK